MPSSHPPVGRGRGRARQYTQENGCLSDVVAPPAISRTTNDVQTPTNVSRGRGHRPLRKAEVEDPDPIWTVSDLSKDQFQSETRPSKPSEPGTIGKPITVQANYFPIIEFPQEGIVYQYDIEIRNRNNRLIQRDHRRAVYNEWLRNFLEKYPDIDGYKIVFDNQKLIFTFDQPLPDIDGRGTLEKISGPNRFRRLEIYDVLIKQVRDRIDLSVLKNISQTQTDDKNTANDLQSAKQILSIVLHENCSSQAEFIFNRSFFSRSLASDRHGGWDLGLGKAIWRGFYSCLVFANGAHQLLMNLDINYQVFTKEQPFLDFLCEVMLRSPCGERHYGRRRHIERAESRDVLEFLDENINGVNYGGEIEFLLKHCKNIFVRSQVGNKTITYKIDGFGEAAATQIFFWETNKTDITVENYYKECYGIELKYPTLPTLKMGNGSFVPMELVHVEPARVTRITDEQQAKLCLKSSLSPLDCSQSIEEIRQNPKQQHFEDDEYIAAWNFKVSQDMLTIPAHVLPMPDVICNDRCKVTHKQGTTRGVWNHSKTEFYKPAHFPSVWALINLSYSMNLEACIAFHIELSLAASERGMQCPVPQIYEEYDVQKNSNEQIIHDLRTMLEKNNDCKFFIAILPENKFIRDQIYSDIKKLCELESGLGIATQMIRLKKEKNEGQQPWNYSRLNNILKEINTKLNGINSIVDIPDEIKKFFSKDHPTMYVGVDLSHGPSGSSRRRSTVAVVASVGDIPIRYLKEIYIQERLPDADGESWETVVSMKEIMKSLIRQYKEHHGYPPKTIIIYRDGISTSEFATVFEKELAATRDACVELSASYRPYITYIVVNKKHHTKFFQTNSPANIEAGTVVDSPNVTNPTTNDFFLNSHHVPTEKGTSRAAHYHVLYDDNKLKPGQVQQLTYTLSYLYALCSSSISIPAPVKYAHLLAFHASLYKNINVESSTESPLTTESDASKIKSKRIVLSSKLQKDSMFFI